MAIKFIRHSKEPGKYWAPSPFFQDRAIMPDLAVIINLSGQIDLIINGSALDITQHNHMRHHGTIFFRNYKQPRFDICLGD